MISANCVTWKRISALLSILWLMLPFSIQAQAPCSFSVNVSSVDASCHGGSDGSATVIVSGATLPYSYSWSMDTTLTSQVATGLAAGTYSVTITDVTGCSVVTGFTIGQPSAPLIVLVSGIDPSCSSGWDGSATASVSGGTAPYSYNWNTDPVQTAATATGLAGGMYTVTVTDLNGCIASDSILLDTVTPVTAVITGIDSICQEQDYPQTVLLIASGGTSYSWSNGSTTNGANVTPMTTTTYSVVVSNGTCSDTAYHTITAFIVPHPWVSGATSACAGDSVTLTAHVGAAFTWNTGDTSSSISVTPSVTTTYTLTAANGMCTDSTTHTLIITSPPASITGCVSPCANNQLVYKTDLQGASNYNWAVPAGWTIVSGQGTVSISVLTGDADSDGEVKLVTTGTGCTAVNIELAADVTECRDQMEIVNTFTPNSDGYNDTWEIKNIQHYPGNELRILNRWGNEVFRTTDYDNTWDGAGLPEGTYFYVLKIQVSDSEDGCAVSGVLGSGLKGYVTIIR